MGHLLPALAQKQLVFGAQVLGGLMGFLTAFCFCPLGGSRALWNAIVTGMFKPPKSFV